MPTRRTSNRGPARTATSGQTRRRKLASAATLLPLALGLAGNVGGPKTHAASEATSRAKHACVASFDSCTETGCAQDSDPDEQLLNRTKRHMAVGSSPKILNWNDFSILQQDADSTVGEKKPLDASDRERLHGISVSNGQVSEGDLVQLDGFIVGKPHPNTGESVNCNFTQAAYNDFHIPFADDPDKTPYQGIVVEMIPQNRPANWSVAILSRVERARRMVRVIGQLFYDNEHIVNADEDNSIGGQPPRFSLFEIHPISSVAVCKQSGAECTDWETWDDFAKEKTD